MYLCPRQSISGRDAPADCTTVSCIRALQKVGSWSGFRRKRPAVGRQYHFIARARKTACARIRVRNNATLLITHQGGLMKKQTRFVCTAIAAALCSAIHVSAGPDSGKELPSHAELQAKLKAIVEDGGNAGFALNMWATIVNRDGEVAAVAFSGNDRGDQWP